MSTFHVYNFGVYHADAILNGTATYAARHVVVRAESPPKAIHAALEIAKQTDSRACIGAGSILYPHGRAAGIVWLIDFDGPVDTKEVAGKELGKKVTK